MARAKTTFVNVALVAVSLTAALLIAEAIARAVNHVPLFKFRNFRVACALMERARSSLPGARVLVMAEYDRWISDEKVERSKKVLDCAKKAGLETLDLLTLSRASFAVPHGDLSRPGHLTAAENELVARALAAALRARPD